MREFCVSVTMSLAGAAPGFESINRLTDRREQTGNPIHRNVGAMTSFLKAIEGQDHAWRAAAEITSKHDVVFLGSPKTRCETPKSTLNHFHFRDLFDILVRIHRQPFVGSFDSASPRATLLSVSP
jgi:hypothetical protein